VHRLRNILVVLFLMAIVAWGCSYFTPQVYAGDWIITMASGAVSVSWMSGADFPFYAVWDGFDGFRTDWWFRVWRFPGMRAIRVPLWVPSGAGAAFAVGITVHTCRRARIRRETGLCVGCGYDLRGSSERCPECAQPFVRETLQADATV
jgi:hypothetical protein